ncbi:unnamed protein product [Lampetra fluviatilis]
MGSCRAARPTWASGAARATSACVANSWPWALDSAWERDAETFPRVPGDLPAERLAPSESLPAPQPPSRGSTAAAALVTVHQHQDGLVLV